MHCGIFFRVVNPDHSPLPAVNVCTEEREQSRGWEQEWGGGQEEEGLPETTVLYKPLVP